MIQIIRKLCIHGIYQIDAIHVHDLFWSFLGAQLNRYYKSKLIIDLHENYPEMIKDMEANYKIINSKRALRKKIKHLVKAIVFPLDTVLKFFQNSTITTKRLKVYEQLMLKNCDRFIVVAEESLERFKDKDFYKKGVIVSNTKDHKDWAFKKLPKLTNKLVVTYVGSIQYLRGLDTLILAMKYLNQSDYDVKIIGIIKGSEIQKEFKQLIDKFSIKNIELVEWLKNEDEAFSYIINSHIGIIPHKINGLTQTTVPHKLFMNMAIGRPVLVSDAAPLKRIVRNAKNGLVFQSGNPIDLAKKLKALRSSELLNTFAKNGRQAAENQYNWNLDKNRLIKLYCEVFAGEHL